MAGVRNLTQVEAAERARLLDVESYDITLDLTDGTGGPGEGTFPSRTVVRFRSSQPGASAIMAKFGRQRFLVVWYLPSAS